MSLLNSLYFIAESDGHGGFTIRFNAAHPVFAGHFPGKPIVPGACLVQIAEELAGHMTGHPVRLTAIRNLKFRQPVTPDQVITVSLQCELSNLKCQIAESANFSATYMCADSDLQ